MKAEKPAGDKSDPRSRTGFSNTKDDDIAVLQSRGTGDAHGRYHGKQQDRVIYGTSNVTDEKEVKRILLAGFEAADKATQHFMEGGSTAIVAAMTPSNKVFVAQLGDSQVLAVVRNKKTGEVFVRDLTKDQRPDSESERERIEAEGGKIVNGRVVCPNGDTLAVSRAFGDHGCPQVSARPSISTFDLSKVLKDDNEVFILACSDGLTDHMTPEDLATEFKKEGAPAEIAERLKGKAFKVAGDTESDNISIGLRRAKPRSRFTTYTGMADGHGHQGGAVAHLARDEIHRAFHHPEKAGGLVRRAPLRESPAVAAPVRPKF
jgi:serine/threonine protein phosphatase PrpC